jgi:ankyrin repeat protein
MSEALQALFAGDLERARRLLPVDAELSVFEAAAFGRVERLKAIVAGDRSQANALSSDGFTPLHLAVFAEQPDAARVLLEHGADVDALSVGSIALVPPLGTAAFVQSSALARLLLDAGADVNRQGGGGFTALHSAAQSGNADFVRLLLEHGADPNVLTADGKRAADCAQTDEVRTLLG